MLPGQYSDRTSYVPGSVDVWVKWTSGATGAVPALGTFAQQSGVVSVVRTGVGLFTITFDDRAEQFLDMSANIIQAAGYSSAGACEVRVVADNIVSAGAVNLRISTDAGVVVDPTTSDVVCLHFILSQNNVQ